MTDRQTDGQTDGIAVASSSTALAMRALHCSRAVKTPSAVTLHKSLAVAEMRDRLAINMGRKLGAAVPLLWS